jgi:ribosome biogenesis GTPase
VHLTELGWDASFAGHFELEAAPEGSAPARVIEESKGFYRVLAESGEYLSEISGRLFHRAEERSGFPAVGDWVVITPRPNEGRATITAILPRRSLLARKQAGRVLDQQILAANLDTVFIVAALNQEFNLRRIERYLAMVRGSGAQPVVLLNKADLSPDAAELSVAAEQVAAGAPVHAISAHTGVGLRALLQYLVPGRTAALIGSSGVGKSSIVNAIAGSALQQTQTVRDSDDRGRHTTTSRQMLVLPCGSLLIDTPGMRELQLWDGEEGLPETFDDIAAVALNCRFRDCQHAGEPDCAIEQAIVDGSLSRERLESYRKMEAALSFQQTKIDAEARLSAKQRIRKLCKSQKEHYKE